MDKSFEAISLEKYSLRKESLGNKYSEERELVEKAKVTPRAFYF
jgi:hypothetical protein